MVEPFSHPLSLSIAHLKPSGFVHGFPAWLWVCSILWARSACKLDLVVGGDGFTNQFWSWVWG